MNRHSDSISSTQWHALAPEYLLLLSIFGSGKTRRRVRVELDRRAELIPRRFQVTRKTAYLQPAA